jgi:rhomboid protease GluP
LHPTSQLGEQVEIFERLESKQGPDVKIDIEPLPDAIFRRLRAAPAVFVIIFLNIAVFAIELWRGALADEIALRRLGALNFDEVINDGEFWRLFTALFLHGSFAHLVFNLIALYIIGPPLERIIGGIRFIGCYLIAGIGSTVGVLLLTVLKVANPSDLVGASGCIMGIVGVWAGFLLRHRHGWQARERLLNIFLIIAIQVLFDLFTPQVSTSAHLCGLITGFAIGLAVQPKQQSF